MIQYKVVETSDVTEESIEALLNEWTAKGWRFDAMHFVVKESARRPTMAFLIFIRTQEASQQSLERGTS